MTFYCIVRPFIGLDFSIDISVHVKKTEPENDLNYVCSPGHLNSGGHHELIETGEGGEIMGH